MKLFSLFFSLAGAILAFFSFAFPWLDGVSGIESVKVALWQTSFAFVVSLFLLVIGIYLLNRISSTNPSLISLSLLMIISSGICLLITILLIVVNIDKGVNISIISFVASLVVLGAIIVMFNQDMSYDSFSRKLAVVGCCIGLSCLLFIFIVGRSVIGIESSVGELKYGAFLNVIGYVIVMVGQFLYPKPD